MKKIILLITVIISINTFAQNKAIINGEIKNHIKDSIRISMNDGIYGSKSKYFKSKIDSKGRFKIVVPLKNAKEAYLETGKEIISLFISPNDSISCTYDDNAVKESILFKGNKSNHYNYFIQYFKEFGLSHGMFFKPDYSDVYNLNPIEFKKYRHEKVEKDLQFLKKYSNNNSLTEAFKQFVEVEIKYSYYYGLLSYHSFKKSFKKIDEKLPLDFYEEINDKLFKNDDYLISYNYRGAINMYIKYLNELSVGADNSPKPYSQRAIELSSEVLNGKTLFNYQLNIISHMLNSDASATLKDSLVSEFLKKCPYDNYNTKMVINYKRNLKANNKTLPKDVIESIFISEEEIDNSFDNILKKNKNKVIYIDVWASWCGPCKIEMPHSMTLKNKFKNDDVTFIYLSIDEKKELWKKAIKDWNIKGQHYLIKDGLVSSFSKHFNIQGIPHYILIDKKGKIIFPSAARPSSKGIETSIKEFLEN